MGLGIYMNNLSDFEDEGVVMKTENIVGSYTPDFMARSTRNIWNVAADALIKKWVGTTLWEDTVHEIKIINTSGNDVVVTFEHAYTLTDEEEVSTIKLGPSGVAYFYGVGTYTSMSEPKKFSMVLRTGSHDRKNNGE